jgi:hypothetical protein
MQRSSLALNTAPELASLREQPTGGPRLSISHTNASKSLTCSTTSNEVVRSKLVLGSRACAVPNIENEFIAPVRSFSRRHPDTDDIEPQTLAQTRSGEAATAYVDNGT